MSSTESSTPQSSAADGENTVSATRLKSQRSAFKGQVTKLCNRADAIKIKSHINEYDIHMLKTIINELKLKITTIEKLNEKLLTTVSDDDIEIFIQETDDYSFDIKHALSFFEKTVDRYNESHMSPAPAPPPASPSSVHFNGANSKNYRLPKLNLTAFDGDILKWQSFHDDFKSAIDDNAVLSNIEKFQYLRSQLGGEAAKTIEGLPLTDANYSHAMTLLRDRYGQPHKVINAYMRALWELEKPCEDLISLRTFYDSLESYIRGLKALGKDEVSYGELLVPMVLDKLPSSVRKQLARDHGNNEWTLQDLKNALKREIEAMQAGEQTSVNDSMVIGQSTAAFYTNPRNSRQSDFKKTKITMCAFCKKTNHKSEDCRIISDPEKRYEAAAKNKLCFNCLNGHQGGSKQCKSVHNCKICNQRHHTALHRTVKKPDSDVNKASDRSQETTKTEHATFVDNKVHGSVLLKTAVAELKSETKSTQVMILFDEGATRSFITQTTAQSLNLKPTSSELLNLTVFGNETSSTKKFDIVQFDVMTEDNMGIKLSAVVVPEIAAPMKNTITRNLANMKHLRGLKLAHPVSSDKLCNISVLIGADFYWDFIGDQVIKGQGPTAVSSKLGYLLSGPLTITDHEPRTTIFHINASSINVNDTVDSLTRFWELESIGINSDVKDNDNSDYEHFKTKYIEKQGSQYIAKLPWKEEHDPLPTNYENVERRTRSMIRKLPNDILPVYNRIIDQQNECGFVERVYNDNKNIGHYLPHHKVHKDSITTPIRIVYDCSNKVNSAPSLNECLDKGPSLLNDLTAILIRFRVHNIAFTADIEKAFLQV